MTASTRPRRFVLAMTGASGAPYAVRLLQTLVHSDAEIHLAISPSGAAVLRQECALDINVADPDVQALLDFRPTWPGQWSQQSESAATANDHARVIVHRHDDFMTPIASGSFQTDAMIVCPCSGSTLSAIARSAASNLIQRAAEVHLKEHRRLIIVPRETPMSVIQLENMHRIAATGAVVLPAMPGWYHGVSGPDDLVDFVVSRILDQLNVDNALIGRWGET
ncbi:UbiX family flavin prenyltransferase [Crateriforma spongiae]|uniref:UbiX family flavin prenyltransferase n=1 Tax=Crateriforma spongiae TaxID=2724528 RepID=UPI0039B0535C